MRPVPAKLVLSVPGIMLVFMLGGCVTSGDAPPRQVVPEEAAQANLQLASEYLKRGENDRALEKLLRAVEQDPDLAPAHAYLGFVYEQLGKPSEAEKYYRSALRLDKQDANVQNMYAVYLCRNDRVTEAEKHFIAAAEAPTYATSETAYTNAGLCLLKLSETSDRAERYFRLALQANPRYTDALWQMAKLTNRMGRDLQSRAFLQRLSAQTPLSAQALWLGVQIERNLGDSRAADQYGEELRSKYPESVEARLFSES